MVSALEADILREFAAHDLAGPAVVDGLTLTDGNPGAQSVYLKLLRLNPKTGPICFQTLDKHNLFGWKIWLLFKHYFAENA